MKNKISIIIPVYNAEKYLEKCVNSILANNYDNYEIILMNDGSKDNSLKVCNDLKKGNNKIKVYTRENKGVSKTRNEAINYATGEYIMYIDNDDYIDNDYLKTFVKEMDENTDIVIGGYRRPDQNNKIVSIMNLKNTEWSKLMVMAPWAKLYRKSYLIQNDFKFLENNIGEDVYFNINALLYTDKVKIIDYIGYNWFYNLESVSNTSQKKISNLDVFNLLDSSYNELKKNGILTKKKEILTAYFFKYIVWFLLYSSKKADGKVINSKYDELFLWLNNHFSHYKKIKIMKLDGKTLKNKIILKGFMLCHKLNLAKLLIRIYSKI